MRGFLVATAVVMATVISACGDDDDSSSSTSTSATATEASVDVDVPDIVGQSVEEATATLQDAGLTLRVVRRDGEDLMATMDLVETRVNVAVETKDGTEVVTEVVSTG